MEHVLDARGLRCPLPYVKARTALSGLGGGDVLVVLATDPEAPVDLGALAADLGRSFSCVPEGRGWRLELGRVVTGPGLSAAAPSSS